MFRCPPQNCTMALNLSHTFPKPWKHFLHYSVYETKKQILWSTDGLSWHSYIIRRLFALSLFLCHPSLSLLPPIFLFLPNSAFLLLSWIIQQRRRRLQRQHEKDRNEEGPRVDGDWLTDCRAFSKGMNSHPSPPPPPQQKKDEIAVCACFISVDFQQLYRLIQTN